MISLLVIIEKVDKDFPHALCISVSIGAASFKFCYGSLEILVADMIFDEIYTVRSPACFIVPGLVLMYRKRLHHWFREPGIWLLNWWWLTFYECGTSFGHLFLHFNGENTANRLESHLWFSDVFRGYRKRSVAWNGLIMFKRIN